jgi:hypothetical protein
MKIFEPLIDQVPSPRGVAMLVMSASEEPACGSVSTIVPVKRPGEHRREVLRLLRRGAELVHQVGRADREAAVGVGRDVGAAEYPQARERDRERQLHPALLRIVGRGDEARLGEGAHRLAHLGDHRDAAVLEARLRLVGLRLCGANFSSAIWKAVSIAASNVARECSAKRGRAQSDSTSRSS